MSLQPSKQMIETSILEMNGGITWVNSPLFFKKIHLHFHFRFVFILVRKCLYSSYGYLLLCTVYDYESSWPSKLVRCEI